MAGEEAVGRTGAEELGHLRVFLSQFGIVLVHLLSTSTEAEEDIAQPHVLDGVALHTGDLYAGEGVAVVGDDVPMRRLCAPWVRGCGAPW